MPNLDQNLLKTLSDIDMALYVRLWLGEHTISELAKRFKVSRQSIYRKAKEWNVTLGGHQVDTHRSSKVALTQQKSPDTKRRPDTKRTEPSHARLLIAAYCDAYKSRYGSYPHVTRKASGQLASLLETMSLDKATAVVQIYLQLEDPWFVKKFHDPGALITNLNQVVTALTTGDSPHRQRDWTELLTPEEKERTGLSDKSTLRLRD